MRSVPWVLFGALVALASPARAEEPLLVVVEAGPRQADAIRSRIGEAISRPVVSLLDESASYASATVSVAVAQDGRLARLCYRDRYGMRMHDVTAPSGAREPSWIVLAVVALLRDAQAMAWAAPAEIIDPFTDDRARGLARVRIPTEVIDPWERRPSPHRDERGRSLGRPRPR